jgi:3',5'-cyclic AMP phosphodiesterase CpdA
MGQEAVARPKGATFLGLVAAALLALAGPAAAATDRPIKSLVADLAPAAGPEADVVFVVSGDSRPTGRGGPLPRVLSTIFSEVALIRPDFVLWSGDLVYGYGDAPDELEGEYEAFRRVAATGGTPFFTSPGNHDIHHLPGEPCGRTRSQDAFESRFGRLYGSFDYAGAHFITLDSAEPCHEDRIDGEQLAWLERDLEANRDGRAIFVSVHTELFPAPEIDPPDGAGHPPLANAEELHRLFLRYPVRAVFSGHEHVFWRRERDGIDYFIAAGGGAPPYAPPDRGGFAHYLVVTLRGRQARYDLVEPGRLYAETRPPGRGPGRTWLVNSNDVSIPVRGLELRAPSSQGPCGRLAARTDLRRYDGTLVPVAARVASCEGTGRARRARVQIQAPRRASVPITIERAP